MASASHRSEVHFTPHGAIYTLGNGNVLHFQQRNGIYYRVETPDAVIEVLEQSRASQRPIRLYYGDTKNGRDWLDEWDMEGCIANSIGPLKVPLLIKNRRSSGGPALLDHCIVKIKSMGRDAAVLYQHSLYHTATFTIRPIGPDDQCGDTNLSREGYTHAVDVDGSNHANFRTLQDAERFIQKMTG